MCSPLRSISVNLTFCHFKEMWLENCPTQFKPVIYKEKIKKYINKQHKNTTFTFEIEQKMVHCHF